jgi:hypothetical protein
MARVQAALLEKPNPSRLLVPVFRSDAQKWEGGRGDKATRRKRAAGFIPALPLYVADAQECRGEWVSG